MEAIHLPRAADGSHVPGPLDRVSFFDEQCRRRRQTWRFTALCGIAAAIVGVPFAMFITPFLYFVVLAALRLAQPLLPIPAEVQTSLAALARAVVEFLSEALNGPEGEVLASLRGALERTHFLFGSPPLTLAALLLPAVTTVVLVWLGYRAFFRKVGVGGELLALGAREPRLDDLEERQLVNLVEEMAIAGGLPPPRVRLLDSPVLNAAAIGTSIEDAVLVVSRGMLDRMDRDETQGVIAHLIGSVGNGDLRIALSITTLFQAIELFFTAFEALFNLSPSAWRDLFRVLRCALTGGSDERATEALARLMEHRLGEFRQDGVLALPDDLQRERPRTLPGKAIHRLPFLLPFVYVLLLPVGLLYLPFLFLRIQVHLFRGLIVGPMVMLVWRTRRYLADATAVQLTRNPDALARALEHLAAEGTLVPGGQWFAHLFVVGSEAAETRHLAAHQHRLAELSARDGGVLKTAVAAYRAAQAYQVAVQDASKGTWAQELGGIASHPPIKKRLKRLAALGARLRAEEKPKPWRMRPVYRVLGIVLTVVLLPVVALLVYLCVFSMVVIFLSVTILAAVFVGLAMPLIYMLLF